MRARVFGVLALSLLLAACDEDPPTAPSPLPAGIKVGTLVPQNGGTVTSQGQPPGAYVLRGSNAIVVPLTLTAGRDLPYAQLMVFLHEANGNYCGENLSDMPVWQPFRSTDTMVANISGFQFGKLPCNVTSIRVFLHTRINPGLLTPPSDAETVAQVTIPANFTIR